MRKNNFQQNFNSMTNIFILILLFLSGLSYADTNGIWQFANDTVPGIFGSDEGAGPTNNYTFINPVYFNSGLHINAFSTFTQLNGDLFYANNATIAQRLTLTGFNCGVNSKLRTDAFGNVICMPDNVNDGVYNLATMKTAVSNDFHNLGGIDKDTFITTQTCAAGKILKSVGKNSKICVADTLASVKNGVSWAEVTGKPTPKNCGTNQYMSDINIGGATIGCKNLPTPGIKTQTCPNGKVLKSVGTNSKTCVTLPTQGITKETDPQVGSLQAGKWCTSNGVTVNCNSAAPTQSLIGLIKVFGTGNFFPDGAGAYCTSTGVGICTSTNWPATIYSFSCPSNYILLSGNPYSLCVQIQ